MTEELKDKLAALAIIMLARRQGMAYKLTDLVDMSSGDLRVANDFWDFLNGELEVGKEYGAQTFVPTRFLRNLEVTFAVADNPSLRAYELNCIIERRK